MWDDLIKKEFYLFLSCIFYLFFCLFMVIYKSLLLTENFYILVQSKYKIRLGDCGCLISKLEKFYRQKIKKIIKKKIYSLSAD